MATREGVTSTNVVQGTRNQGQVHHKGTGAGAVFFKRAHTNTTVKFPLYIIKIANKTIKNHFQMFNIGLWVTGE